MSLFFEIKVRVNGEEKWVNGHKVFKYLLEEYSKVNYEGKTIDPYNTRIDKFYSNIPQALLDTWKKAYPNVNINQEIIKIKAWLLSNTSKAKKDFKRFTNNWLARAMDNGGTIPDGMEHKVEKQIKKHKEYMHQAKQDSASREEIKEILADVKKKLSNK